MILKKNTAIKFIVNYYDYLIIAIIYLILHFFMHTDYWDDVITTASLTNYNFNIIEYMTDVYQSWSSRIIVQTVGILVAYFPNILWKILDVIMIMLLYHFFIRIIDLLTGSNNNTKTSRLWQMLCFLSFPYCLMGTAGWITTTVVYTWVFALAFFCIYIMLSCSNGRKISLPTYFLYGFSLLYAANFDIASITLFFIFIFIFFMCKRNKQFNILFAEGILLIIFNILLFVFCPGNRNRNAYDAIYHDTADLLELSFFGKLRMGINSTFYHFISVPNAVLFITCLVIFIGVCLKTKNAVQRVLGGLPLILDIIWTGYVFIFYTIKNHQLTYIYPDGSFTVCPKLEQYLVLLSALLMIAFLIYFVAWLTDFSSLSWSIIYFIITWGLLPEIALGFTTTVSTSIIRTSSFLYFALMGCSIILVKHCVILKHRFYKNILFVVGTCGTLLNLLQTLRHILVYG